MNSIRDATIAVDTNVFVFALRKNVAYPACETLLFDKLTQLHVYVPLQVLVELRHNVSESEMRAVLRALTRAKTVTWDYAPAQSELVRKWVQRGAKKGDAVIAAHLEQSDIWIFVSENRHFLRELSALPFEVLNSQQAVDRLAKKL